MDDASAAGKRKRTSTLKDDFDYEEEAINEKKVARKAPPAPRPPKVQPTLKVTVTQPLLELTAEEKVLLAQYAEIRKVRESAVNARHSTLSTDQTGRSQEDISAKAEEATKAAIAALAQSSASVDGDAQQQSKPVHRGPSRRLAPPREGAHEPP